MYISYNLFKILIRKMSHNFRIEPIAETKLVKIYARKNDHLPVPIDCENRFHVLFAFSEEFLDPIQDFEVRPDDIWVLTQPKSGTTWMLELLWLLQNNFDYETALKIEQEVRVPYFEFCTAVTNQEPNSLNVARRLPSPRVIKSHLPMHLLPKGLWTVRPKIIYVARDLKDAVVSFFHYNSKLGMFKGTKEELVNSIIEDKIRFCPFWLHAVEFWMLRNEPNIFFTSFERMKKDLPSVILKAAKLLQKNVDKDQMEKLLEHLSFEKMRDNPACNHEKESLKFQAFSGVGTLKFRFIRKGEVNSHKEELSEEIIQRLNNFAKARLDPYGVTAEQLLLS